jgi:hypothetical protein
MLDLAEKLKAAKDKALNKVGYVKGEKFRWRGADRLEVGNRLPDWGYRWIENSPESIQKRESEGFLIVNEMTGIPGDTNTESDGMDGSKKHRELVLAALPEELKAARTEKVQELTERQTAGLKENLEEGLAGISGNHDGHAEGKIVID